MNVLRPLVRRALEIVDSIYRRNLRLTPVGPLLFVGVEQRRRRRDRHRAAQDADAPRVAHLHFNNARAAGITAATRLQNGVRFARLLRQSFAELAVLAREDALLRNVAVYEGITWFAPHGATVGFESDAIPAGWRRHLLTAHFRLLVWAFSPTADRRALAEVAPRRFRISRDALIGNFSVPR